MFYIKVNKHAGQASSTSLLGLDYEEIYGQFDCKNPILNFKSAYFIAGFF